MGKMHKYVKIEPVMAYQVDKEETVHTLYGEATASKGDYVIEGAFHELYPCKKEVFESTYCKVSDEEYGFSFSEALYAIKAGSKCTRRGWNGKKQYIELARDISYVNSDDEVINADHEAIGNCAIAFVGTSGVQIGWLASQADMLADDWYVVDLL